MSELAIISALCVISAVMCKFFDTSLREYKPLFTICACMLGLYLILGLINPICVFVSDMLRFSGASEEYASILFKSAAITLIAQLGADVCKDANETALSSIVQIAARISLAAMSVTLLADIADTVLELTS